MVVGIFGLVYWMFFVGWFFGWGCCCLGLWLVSDGLGGGYLLVVR